MPRLSLILTPADVTVFRDSRPFGPGDTGSRSEFPPPRAVAGAIRSWLLSGFGTDLVATRSQRSSQAPGSYRAMMTALREATPPCHRWVLNARFDGPFLCNPKTLETFFAAPFHLVRPRDAERKAALGDDAWDEPDEGTALQRAFPWEPPDGTLPDGWPVPPGAPAPRSWRPVLWCSSEEWELVSSGFLSESHLESALRRNALVPAQALREPSDFYLYEPRFGIGMDPQKGTARETMLYTTDFLRLRGIESGTPFGFRVDLTWPEGTPGDPGMQVRELASRKPWLRLGGEGRVTSIEVCDGLSYPKAPPPPPPGGRFLTYLATPGLFPKNRWYPDRLACQATLVAAITGTPRALSGWDASAGVPVRTRFAIPAGAVYFWQLPEGRELEQDPHGTSLSDEPGGQQAGWGIALRGEW